MINKYTLVYYDFNDDSIYLPYGSSVRWCPRDQVNVRFQLATGKAWTPDSLGRAPNAYTRDMSLYTAGIFAIKTQADYDARAASFAAAWYLDPTDTDWHDPAHSRFSFICQIVSSLAAGNYVGEASVYADSDDWFTFGQPFTVPVVTRVDLGTEIAPSNPILVNSFTIPEGVGSVSIAVPGISDNPKFVLTQSDNGNGTVSLIGRGDSASGQLIITAGDIAPVNGWIGTYHIDDL